MRNINKMANNGALMIAGPFGNNDQQYRDVFILKAKNIEEARKLCDNDPTVKTGVFAIDYVP